MSVQAISWVLEHSPARGTQRLVLIALANHAGTNPVDGAWESYPGVETIAVEAGCDNVRTVQYALKNLLDTGQIEREINGAPDDRIRPDRRPNLYRILTAPKGGTQHPTHTHEVTFPSRSRGANPRTPQPNNGVKTGAPRQPDNGVQTPAPRDPGRGENGGTPPPVDNHTNGVQENDTPQPPRGETRPRHGVNAVAPKPSENPSDVTRAVNSRPDPAAVDKPPAHPRTADETSQRLSELLNRRTDRPTNTTGLRTGREALAAARART